MLSPYVALIQDSIGSQRAKLGGKKGPEVTEQK